MNEGKPIITTTIFSPEIAAKLRSKEVSAFIPIPAAELIWLETLGETDANENGRGRYERSNGSRFRKA